MQYPEFPAFGFTVAVLVLIPLPRQIRAGNIACVALIFWFFEHSLVAAINAIIWAGNVNNTAPVWCDITNKLRDGASIALPAATLCICKHLEFIASRRPVTSGERELGRKIFEFMMCFVLPAFWMFLTYCFQTGRFIINENFGCFTSTWPSNIITIVLYGPELLLSVITLIYGSLALYHLIQNHQTNVKFLAPHLRSRDSAISSRQYYRLMAMSMFLGVWGVIWLALDIKYIVSFGSLPIPSWSEIHSDIRVVYEVPTIHMGPNVVRESRLLWWGVPGAALMFFLLFGTSLDVLSEYVQFGRWIMTKVFRIPAASASSSATTQSSSIRLDTAIVLEDLESKMPVSPRSFHSRDVASSTRAAF